MAFLKTDTVKPLQETLVLREGNTIRLNFNYVENAQNRNTSHESREYIFDSEIMFKVRVISVTVNTVNFNYENDAFSNCLNIFYICGENLAAGQYRTFKLTSALLGTVDRSFDMRSNHWHLIGLVLDIHMNDVTELRIELEGNTINAPFGSLYNDTNLTDFELRGDNGSVSVHRAVLAASSPVLRTMLEGTWKETKDGGVKIPNTTRATLQLFKQYLYLNILPVEGLENLLLLASCYMIDDLEEKCMRSLVNTLTPKNVLLRTQFAVQNGITELHVMILERVQAGDINVQEVRRNLDNNK